MTESIITRSMTESCDRLSELPDSLIFDIFWLMPMRDVVRTTALSKRWKNLWTIAPCLNFEVREKDFRGYLSSGYRGVRDFINRALFLWRGSKIKKFKINFKSRFTKLFGEDFEVWARFAKEKEAEEIYLQVERYDIEPYMVPQCLYSCSSLKVLVLSLKFCRLSLIGRKNVIWDRLKSLTIDVDNGLLRQQMIKQGLRGSPNLEEFNFSSCDMDANMCVQSTSLKKLSVRKYLGPGYSCVKKVSVKAFLDGSSDPWKNRELKIKTPNLETLEISGLPYSKCSLNVSSLKDVTLGFEGRKRKECDNLKEYLEETLRQILPTIQHVESVALSDWCIKVLGTMNKKNLLSPLPKVKLLKLKAGFSKHEEIAGLLEIFPEMQRLVIEDRKDEKEDDDQEPPKFEPNLPDSFLLQLRTVEVTLSKHGKSIYSFIEILLKYASKLEKMMVRVKGTTPPSHPSNFLFLTSEKLLRMPRSSPTARLVFYE